MVLITTRAPSGSIGCAIRRSRRRIARGKAPTSRAVPPAVGAATSAGAGEVDVLEAALARALRGRSAAAYAGVVIDRDAVPEGEIDAHGETRIVANAVTGVGGQGVSG